MAGLVPLLLLQLAATVYLIYRVHRLEQMFSSGVRPGRRSGQGEPGRKVIPLFKSLSGFSRGRPGPGNSEPKR